MLTYRTLHSLLATQPALLLVAACDHSAWLGMQCPSAEMRCDDAGPAAHGGAADAAAGGAADAAPPAHGAVDAAAPTAKNDAGRPALDTQAPAMPDAAMPYPATCRDVTMNYFASEACRQ